MKVYDFVLECKRPSYRLIDGISQFMLLLSLSVFLLSAFTPYTKGSIVLLVICAAIAGWWVYLYRRKRKGVQPFFRMALFLSAIGWYIQPGGLLLACIYVITALLEKQVKFPQELAFDSEEVVFNSFPRKHFLWTEFQQVILKDGILTIDFINNKLIQKEIEAYTSVKDEQDFNAFCAERLRVVRQLPGV